MKKYFKRIIVLMFAVMIFLPFVVKADEKYTVTFDTQGGSEIPNQEIENGGVVVKPEDPTNGNLEFVKWVINDTETYDFSKPVTSNLTIQSMWKVKVNAHTYPDNAGVVYTGIDSESGKSDNELTWTTSNLNDLGEIRQIANDGYVFKEWRIGSQTGEVVGNDSSIYPYNYNGSISFKLNDNYVFYAIYEKTPVETPVVNISSNNNKITLSWDNQSFVTKTEIYRSLDNKKWKKVSTVTTDTYTEKSLTFGKTYYYKVRVYGNNKWSSYSNVVSKKIVPNKVNGLKIKSANTNTIKLEWDKVGATGYVVYRSTDNKKWTKISTITKNTTVFFDDTKLKANKRYYYRVRSYKTVSGTKVYGKYSTVVNTKTAPSKPTITLKNAKFDSIIINFELPKGTSYIKLAESYDNFKTIKDSDNYVPINEIPPTVEIPAQTGETFYYKVRACNSENRCSKWTIVSKKVTSGKPKLKLSSTKAKRVNVKNIIKIDMIDGFEIYRSTSKYGKYEKVKEITENTDHSEYEVGQVSDGTIYLSFNDKTKSRVRYYYKVRIYTILENGKKLRSPYSDIKTIVSK